MSVQRLTTAAALSPLPAARGSSFYAALRILPTEQRRAMMAIYGFCRAVDDIADRQGDRAPRLAELGRWRREVADLYAQLLDVPCGRCFDGNFNLHGFDNHYLVAAAYLDARLDHYPEYLADGRAFQIHFKKFLSDEGYRLLAND